MDSEELEEQIKKVLLKNIREALDDFENYIYKEKYKEAALKEGFYPTSEDFEIRSELLNNYFKHAQKSISDLGSKTKPYLTELYEEYLNSYKAISQKKEFKSSLFK